VQRIDQQSLDPDKPRPMNFGYYSRGSSLHCDVRVL
jgi:hypothetical protein